MASVQPSDLPRHIASYRLPPKDPKLDIEPRMFDVKFYPYANPGQDSVFAFTGGTHVVICRPSLDAENGMEILQWIKDADQNAGLNSIAWSKDEANGDPLICVAGSSRKIMVLNALTGELEKTLAGHGAPINDLVTSPLSPNIIASASEDQSIRIWNLSPAYAKYPCQAICAGEGHTAAILTIAFHSTGKYLLSGGMDTRINMWAIPDLPDENANTDKTTIIHYPHFSTFEVHYDYVDCVVFHGDLILSKSVVKDEDDGQILLWKIDGFDSTEAPKKPVPTYYKDGAESRSAFGNGHKLLMTFKCPLIDVYYMRFQLFNQPSKRPILAAANRKTQLFFWDLYSLEMDESTLDFPNDKTQHKTKTGSSKGKAATSVSTTVKQSQRLSREESTVSTTSSTTPQPNATGPQSRLKWDIGDPFTSLKPHKAITIPGITFIARCVAWSPGGEWCVVVGDYGMVSIFHRTDVASAE